MVAHDPYTVRDGVRSSAGLCPECGSIPHTSLVICKALLLVEKQPVISGSSAVEESGFPRLVHTQEYVGSNPTGAIAPLVQQ